MFDRPVLHIINSLYTGGAELLLQRLLQQLAGDGCRHQVLSLRDCGRIGDDLAAAGIPVHALGASSVLLTPAEVVRLVTMVRSLRPVVIQGWLYYGNLAAWFASLFAPDRPALCWNIRHSLSSLCHETLPIRLAIRGNALLSARPEVVLYNSRVAKEQHAQHGFKPRSVQVIPNGFDTTLYAPRPEWRQELRAALGIPEESLVIGLFGRYHPMKGHRTFLDAAARFATACPLVHFVLAGSDVTWDNQELAQQARAVGAGRVQLLGERQDIPRLLNALDLLSTSSGWGEAFPNVLGEALASGVPCVATAVGDSAEIIDGAGRIVPPDDPKALAAAWQELWMLGAPGRRELGRKGRERIVERFSLATVAGQYQQIYARLAESKSR